MPNPYTAGPGDGCMVHAGILIPHGGDKSKSELTSGFPEAAKEKFIEDVIKELTGGSPPFPCGDPLPVISPEMAERLRRDLPNKEIFPDFHKNILDYYRDLARSMDNPSEYNMLPVADPVALATSLGANFQLEGLGDFIGFMIPNPPMLAAKLELPLPELPGMLAKLPIPKLPPGIDIPLPELPQLGIGLPSIEIPSLLNFKLSMVLNFPDFMAGLIVKIPSLALKLFTLDIPGALGEVCKLITDSQLFGAPLPPDKNGVSPDSVLLASKRVLARKMAEMSLCHALSKTLGTAPAGITGLTMKELGYSQPLGQKDEEDPETSARRRMMKLCFNAAGTYWSDNPDKYAYFVLPKEASENISVAKAKCEAASSCGMFARTVLATGGATFYMDPKVNCNRIPTYYKDRPEGEASRFPSNGEFGGTKINYDWFNDVYKGNAVADIIQIARMRGALMPPLDAAVAPGIFCNPALAKSLMKGRGLPSLKAGDLIIIGSASGGREHMIVVAEDYKEGNTTLTTVEAGAIDISNEGTATYINRTGAENASAWKSSIVSATSSLVTFEGVKSIVPAPKTGFRCTGIARKTYRLVDSYIQAKPLPNGAPLLDRYMGTKLDGGFAMGDGRIVMYLIDSWKLISGNPNAAAGGKQPGSDPLNSKEQPTDAIDPITGQIGPIGETNDETLEDQNIPPPPLVIVPEGQGQQTP